MDYLAMNESGLADQHGSFRGRMGRKRTSYDETGGYKSKNLHAERRRREKLSNRLLTLRALVPIITNMNKGTIIEDAITYIQELKKNVEEMEASSSEEETKTRVSEIDASEEMKQCGIKEDVQVSNIDGDKLWIKIILEKKRGGFGRLMEKMACFGLELIDSNVTTSKGAMLVTACVEGAFGDNLTVQQTKELLTQIIKGI
uniref:BHLH domain-containing protein n=1 Tax=Salix viminalis TaxID=40686 RepID=A0A6N2KXG2_SALVM